MNALVQDRCKLPRGMSRGKVRPSDVANKKCVPRENGRAPVRLAQIVHQNANAFHGMAGSLQKPEEALSELNFVSVRDRNVGELSSRAGTEPRA